MEQASELLSNLCERGNSSNIQLSAVPQQRRGGAKGSSAPGLVTINEWHQPENSQKAHKHKLLLLVLLCIIFEFAVNIPR